MSVVEMHLCLDGSAVPLEKKTLAFVDPYSLAEEPDELLPMSLVPGEAHCHRGPELAAPGPVGGGGCRATFVLF